MADANPKALERVWRVAEKIRDQHPEIAEMIEAAIDGRDARHVCWSSCAACGCCEHDWTDGCRCSHLGCGCLEATAAKESTQ